MNEGKIQIQSYLDQKNNLSISAWKERAWHFRSNQILIDPRDKRGMRSFHNYRRKLARLHRTIGNIRLS